MPQGAVRKGAKHAGSGKLSIERDTASESSAQSKQQRQRLRHASQKTADEYLDALLAEQLHAKDRPQCSVPVAGTDRPE
eukprot:2908000-Amphidinium_carterae.1